MAFTVTNRGTADSGTGTAGTIAVGAFTPSASSLLFLYGQSETDNASSINPTASVPTGGSLTFNVISEVEGAAAIEDSGFEKVAGFYYATVGASPGSMTITWDGTTGTAAWYTAGCFDVTGHATSGTIVQTATMQAANPGGASNPAETVTLASTPAVGNLVIACFSASVVSGSAIAAPTIGGQSMTAVHNNSPNDYEQHAIYYRVITGTESNNVITCSSCGGTETYATFAAAVEILAGSSDTSLTVADSSSGSTVDNVALTQAHTLAVADSASGSTIDNVVLDAGVDLTVADSTSGSTIDNVVLTQAHTLTVADSTSGSTAEAVVLTQAHTLAVADSTSGSTIDNITLSTIDFPYPASVSGRRILDQSSNPWALQGVAVWTATQNLSNANITTLLEGLAARGVNFALMAPCGLEWHNNTNKYRNAADAPYFATTAGGSTEDTAFSGELGTAWSSVDHFIDECVRLEITVGFCHYAGFGTDDTDPSTDTYGQAAQWLAVTNGDMQTYGAAVANRYPASTYPNLIWVYSADRSFGSGSNVAARLDAIAQGVASVDSGARLQMAHPDKKDNGTYTSGEDQFGTGYTYVNPAINTIYSYQSEVADEFDAVYTEATMPVVNIEPVYAHNTGTEVGTNPVSHGSGNGQHLREQAWVSIARGGSGIVHGDEDLWPFGATGLFSGGGTWQEVLDDADGTHDDPLIWLSHLFDFIAANSAWSDLAPDADTFLTGGEGTGSARAAAGLSGSLAIVYFPSSRGSITVDTTQLTGTANVRLRWFDPTDGSYTSIAASEAQNAARAITYPTSNTNANSSDDWVLVVDLTGDATLAVADSASGSTIDNVALTQAHTLAVADSASGSTIDNVVLTQVHVLVVADSTSGSTADGLTLTQAHTITVADSTSGSTIDNVVLDVSVALAVADSTSGSTIDGLTLTQVHVLVVADVASGSTADNVVLTQAHVLVVADVASGSTIDNVVLSGEIEIVLASTWRDWSEPAATDWSETKPTDWSETAPREWRD